MDDYQVIEIIEAVRTRLRDEIPDLDSTLAKIVRVNYRNAAPSHLQECLAEIFLHKDARKPADLREISRRIAAAESLSPAPMARATGSWVMQETAAIELMDPEQDIKFAKGLRYLSLPAIDISHSTSPLEPGITGTTVPGIPSRFAQELVQCISLRSAITLTRKRLPGLKGIAAYQFLAAIGYPVAVPTADAQRFSRYIGLLSKSENAIGEDYMAIVDRAARITNLPASHIGYLLSLYSGGAKVDGFSPVCTAKKPRCGECPLAGRCTNYAVVAASAPVPARGRPIHEWAADERPRERLLAGERLSNSELLAIILRTGSGRLSAVELARELLHTFQTLHDLEKASPQDIVTRMRGKGIGPAKAVEICAAIELGRRVTQPAADTRLGMRQITSSRDIFEICRTRYKTATQEEFLLLILNTKNRVQKEVSVSVGTLNSSIVHPRDVFRHALREAAAAVIFVHNHPSGDPSPSDEDILLTARLVDAGKLLGIQVLDHVIIGSHEWYSFADHGRLK